MSDNEMKELQPGQNPAEIGAGGLPVLGRGSAAGEEGFHQPTWAEENPVAAAAALIRASAAGRVELSPTVGVPDPIEDYFSKMAAKPTGLKELQEFLARPDVAGLAEDRVIPISNTPGLTHREMKKIVLAIQSGQGTGKSVEQLVREARRPAPQATVARPPEPQPAPPSLSATAIARLAQLESAGIPLEEALLQMGQEGLVPLGELGKGVALDYYKRMKEEAVREYEKIPENKRHDWIQRQAIAILNAHQPQEASYERILLSLTGSRFSTNRDRELVESLDSVTQSYSAYESLTGPEGLEQATARIPNDAHISAFVDLGRTWKVRVRRASGQEINLSGRVSIGKAMDWMQEDWGLKVCTEDSITRDINEGLFIKFLLRKALRDNQGNQVLGDDEDFEVLSAEDVEMGDRLNEKELKRFVSAHGWLVKGAYLMHEIMTTLFDIDPTLRLLNVDGLKSTQAQPEYHDGYNIGVTEGRFYRETWHDNFINNKADKLLPFISKVPGLSDEDKALIRSKVSVFPMPIEMQNYDWEYLTGAIDLSSWRNHREGYIRWLRSQGFETLQEMQRVVSPLRMREFAERELWVWSDAEKQQIANRDFRPALKYLGIPFEENNPATYRGYLALRRCVKVASYETYTWELLKKKDFPKYAGKYMERAGKMGDAAAGCFRSLGISPKNMEENAFLEARRDEITNKFEEAMGNVMSYQSGNGQFLAGLNLLVGLVRSGCVNRQIRPMTFTRDGVQSSTVKLVINPEIRARVERAKAEGFRILDDKYVINGNNQAVREYSQIEKDYCPNLQQYRLPPLDWNTVLELIQLLPNASEPQKDAVKEYLIDMINLKVNQITLYRLLEEQSQRKAEERKSLNEFTAEGRQQAKR